ncbi:MAG: hypothetical protein B0A82_06035 [Alkalinema sp. CACIAM 70d]|nr:MAG: hypothetical protein B0A82_06035 [Alkalinema sp. CACIAM 70d]
MASFYQFQRSLFAIGTLLTIGGLTHAASAQSIANTISVAQPMTGQVVASLADFEQNPGNNQSLPVVNVTTQNFTNAKGWRITWTGGVISDTNWTKVQSIFSTVTGAVNSIQYLNNTSWGNTDNADFMLYFGLKATSEVSQLTKANALKETHFKLSSMTVTDLANAAQNNPNIFGLVYELGFDQATTTKPNYQAGQIYVFKTDRNPAKYGAVRIVSMNPRTIEVVVQK